MVYIHGTSQRFSGVRVRVRFRSPEGLRFSAMDPFVIVIRSIDRDRGRGRDRDRGQIDS